MKFDINKLKKEQERLAKKVIIKDSFDPDGVKLIGGCDQAFFGNKIISVIVVLDKENKLIEKKYAIKDIVMPYIPGYLAYREMPAVLEAYNKLEHKPDILMCDCNGILHPRKIGMASHIGIILEIPTIGISKQKLVGIANEEKKIIHDGQILGSEIITKEHAKPVYVSPGHMISMKTAEKVVREWLTGHKSPEPLHIAHKIANSLKKKISQDEAKANSEKTGTEEVKVSEQV